MGQMRFVVDGAACMPPELAKKYDFAVVPFAIQFGNETYMDNGKDLTAAQFEAKCAETGIVPKTGVSAVGRFIEIYRSIAKPGDTIFSIHVASRMSGTAAIAKSVVEELPDLDIVVFNSDSVGMAEGFMAVEAAEAARAGKGREEIIALLERLKRQTDFLSTSVEFEYIRESGRVIGAERAADAAVKSIPIIRLKDGITGIVEQARTQNGALRRTIELIKERAAGKPIKRIAISHANREEAALRYREMVESELSPQDLVLGQLGITLTVHLGPGALATSVLYTE